jgi:hypothetical protein
MTKIEQRDWTAPKKHPRQGETFRMVVLTFDEPFPWSGGDREAMLVHDFNCLCDVEAETGLNLGMLSLRNPTSQQTRGLVCAYLRTAHAISLQEAGDLLTRDQNAVLEAMSMAMNLARLGEEKKEEPVVEPASETANVA